MNADKLFDNLPGELISGDEVFELKFLKAYVYNAYFNADSVKTNDVLDGITYSRKNKFGIDGVFINDTLEEDTIECVYSYCPNEVDFEKADVLRALDYISSQIDQVRQRKFTTNDKSDSLLGDYISDMSQDTDKKVSIIIRIITNMELDEKDKYEFVKAIENHPVNVKTLNVTGTILFGDDVAALIDANTAPYDYVADGKLIVDDSDNVLKYGDDSFICNIKAQSLKALWKLEGTRGLLAMNLRYYIKSANIDAKIEDSILFNGDNFWYLNNGIIIVCDEYYFKGNELHMKNFSIVNGGQTTRMIGTIPFDNDFSISCKVVKNNFTTDSDKNVFISQVAEASNTQKPIKAKDVIANKVEQRNLKSMMSAGGIFIEIKRGEKYDHAKYKEPWQRTKNNELAQDLYSFVYMEPGPARNNVSKILQNEEKYNIIFKNHEYSFEFLKDLLVLEKCFREYQKFVSKDENASRDQKGLVKNGLHYMLATIGYILKLCYNKEYYENMNKYRNTEVFYNLYSPELAFMHKFITNKVDYKEFKKYAFNLFDIVLNNLIIPAFTAVESNAGQYSNWLKTNTGFNTIRRFINMQCFDNKDDSYLKVVKKFFLSIDEETMNENIDRYVDYCKKNRKITAKTSDGFELNEEDEALRNELMIYRQTYSINKHIAEKFVFTDKMLDRLVMEKPLLINDLKKIINAQTAYYCGNEIIKIIEKHI